MMGKNNLNSSSIFIWIRFNAANMQIFAKMFHVFLLLTYTIFYRDIAVTTPDGLPEEHIIFL